ncbi:MAG: hypothetical protein AAFZ15_16080 [Bacteroidota bacterium]
MAKQIIYPLTLSMLLTIFSMTLYGQHVHMETDQQEVLRNFWINAKGELYVTYYSYEKGSRPQYNSETLSKFDTDGQLLWTKNYERGDYGQYAFFTVDPVTGEEVIYYSSYRKLKGKERPHPLIFKVGPDGEVVWEKVYKDIDLKQTSVALYKKEEQGYTFSLYDQFSKGQMKGFELKTINEKGKIIKEDVLKLYLKEGETYVSSIFTENDSQIAAFEHDENGQRKRALAKTDGEGNRLWKVDLYSPRKGNKFLHLLPFKDGVVVHYSESGRSYMHYVNGAGEEEWKYSAPRRIESFESVRVHENEIHCLVQFQDQIGFVKLSENGAVALRKLYQKPMKFSPSRFFIHDNTIYVGGYFTKEASGNYNNDLYFFKTDFDYRFPEEWEKVH